MRTLTSIPASAKRAIHMFHRILILLVAFLVCGLRAEDVPKPLLTAAAADLKFALDELVKAFSTNNPAAKVSVTYGSSGNFYAQLQNQAPFDLFFSADVQYSQKLAESGLALDRSVFVYAVGRIVDIENAALFLASEAASYINGVTLVVDGGSWLLGTSLM